MAPPGPLSMAPPGPLSMAPPGPLSMAPPGPLSMALPGPRSMAQREPGLGLVAGRRHSLEFRSRLPSSCTYRNTNLHNHNSPAGEY